MMKYNIRNCYFHGLGGYLDKDNQETSYYRDIVKNALYNLNEHNHSIISSININSFDTEYDLVSLERLKKIIERGEICSRDASGYELPIFSFSENPSNTVCLSKKRIKLLSFRKNAFDFSKRSLSIILSKELPNFCNTMTNWKEIELSNPQDISLMYEEYRVLNRIPINLFEGIGLPISSISNHRFNNLNQYYEERKKEIYIIKEMLREKNIILPIIDINTGSVIEMDEDIKKLIKLR